MGRRRVLRAFTLALALHLIAVSSAWAIVNEFSATITSAPSPVYDGIKGNMNIRTDPATVVSVGFVHIVQADVGPLGGDFIAVGTSNGAGTDGGQHDCANDYDPGWTGYYDYVLGGLYWCYLFSPDAWAVGNNPSFKIEYAGCPPSGNPGWVLTFATVVRACQQFGTTAARSLVVGLETVNFTNPPNPADRNIDVKFSDLKRNLTNSTSWVDLGQSGQPVVFDFYDYTIVSNTAQNFFLAPLN
jgi:hypothetical protein